MWDILSHITRYNISRSRCCFPCFSHLSHAPTPTWLPRAQCCPCVTLVQCFSLILVQHVVWDISNRTRTLNRGANNCSVFRDIFTFHQALQSCSEAGMGSSCWLLWCLFYSGEIRSESRINLRRFICRRTTLAASFRVG